MIVVSDNFLWRPPIQHGQLIHSTKDVFQLCNGRLLTSIRFELLKPFFECPLDRPGKGLSAFLGHLAREPLYIQVLYAHRHTS